MPVNLAEALQQVIPPVQEFKRRALTRPDGGSAMSPALVALRDERVVAVVTAPRMAAVLAAAPTLAVGLAPQMLVLAAQVSLPERAATDQVPAQAPGEGIAYTTMTREREGAFAVQRYLVRDGQATFAGPVPGSPEDTSTLEALAGAMSHAPLDPTQVSRAGTGEVEQAGAANAPRLPESEGRLVLDAGTVRSVRTRLDSAGGGTVLFVAASPEHATALMAHGMDREALLGSRPS